MADRFERVKLSCCVITYNEADRIEACLSAARAVADDLVVIDSGSTDGTVALAEALGARVMHRDWEGFGQQKRFAESQALHDWVLNLDADEVLTPKLADEIRRVLASPPEHVAYRTRIVTVFPGQRGPRWLAEVYNNVRLYDRRRVRYRDSPVHDRVETGSHSVGQLQAIIHHFSSRSIAHSRDKLRAYFALQVKTKSKNKLLLILRLPFEYLSVFLKYYIIRRNCTGGLYGLQISHMAASERVRRLWLFLTASAASRH